MRNLDFCIFTMDREPNQISNDLPDKELTLESLSKNGIEVLLEHKNPSQRPANIISLQAELLNMRNIVTMDDAEHHACSISKEASNMRKGTKIYGWLLSNKRFSVAGVVHKSPSDPSIISV